MLYEVEEGHASLPQVPCNGPAEGIYRDGLLKMLATPDFMIRGEI